MNFKKGVLMNNKKKIMEAVLITFLFIGSIVLSPAGFTETTIDTHTILDENNQNINDKGPFQLDRKYILEEQFPQQALTDDGSNDDCGYKRDAGGRISRYLPVFPGEPTDNTPGRGSTGKISEDDEEDWYAFQIGDGQSFTISVNPPSGFNVDLYLYDDVRNELASSMSGGDSSESISFTAEYTGRYYFDIVYVEGEGEGQYTMDVQVDSQNDLGTGSDAGNSFSSATPISPGEYIGYLDANDEQDWYSFNANAGQGIHFELEMNAYAYLSDFDISLYNPNGDLVYEKDHYYDDELLYPADMSGTWTVKIDIFPGYANAPQPTEWKYYSYGSGPYKLTFSMESTAPEPPAPIPQPQITPIAQTFVISNTFDNNADEYGYLASIPASNYLEGGQRYLSPIVYENDETPTNWFGVDEDRGTVDDTTQYVLDDWNEYLSQHDITIEPYQVPTDPVKAAAEIATNHWDSTDLAVIAVDGSEYENNVETVISEQTTLQRKVERTTLDSDDSQLQSSLGKTMMLGKEWGAMTLEANGITISGSDAGCTLLTNLYPNYMPMGSDWWPIPYDGSGDANDLYLPITTPGFWSANTELASSAFSEYVITKIAGDRYPIQVTGDDASIEVTITSEEPSDLLVFLVDSDGNLRAPSIPRWNGPVLPIHEWYGFENPEDNPWRSWDPEPHTEFSTEALHAQPGEWTAIVVPRYAQGNDVAYEITGNIINGNSDRSNAIVSASNAAVIASQEHVPLLFVKEDSVPSETAAAISALGISKVIFVEKGNIGEAVKSDLPTIEEDLTTMKEIIDKIKSYEHSENYITITSIKSGDGYFAPSAMLAAYHCSPMLRIGDAEEDPAAVADRIESWRIWDGDYYHGSRATGHLPIHSEPLAGEGELTFQMMIQGALYVLTGGSSGSIPPLGLDAKRYWNEELYDGIYNFIDGLGLDLEGQEALCFVAPREDINVPAHSVMLGNNSYAGHIPGITPSYANDIVIRSILYPALIFANPNRDVTTSQLMNFPDGWSWTTNDGEGHKVYSSRVLKESFGSHFRDFQGHCLWDAHLEEMNDGASLFYYSGHGTGGSGISAQYLQTEHCPWPEQEWWDAWRGYSSYDNWKFPRQDGTSWYNAETPSLYDIIQYDHVDRLFENLRSNAVFYMSCTTADGYGPMVYLDHGAVLWYGNAGSGLCPEADLQDDEFFKDLLIYGDTVGEAYSKQVWLHYRDFTTSDPTSMYGPSTMNDVTTVQCIYGDPELIIYSPEWSSPEPINP